MMQLVFGKIPTEFLEDNEETFVGFNSKNESANFYFRLDVEEEGDGNGSIRITDTCGRFIPMDFNQLDELMFTLQTLQEYRRDRSDFTSYWKSRFGYPQ